MQNLILHVTLPQGLALTTGASLQAPVTFDIVSSLNPYYASVDQVKLIAGPVARKLQDVTIACDIYNVSKQADLLLVHTPTAGDNFIRFVGARNQWVQAKVAREILLTLGSLTAPGSHVLANFSVTRQKGFQTEGTPELLKDLKKQIKDNETVIRSGGRISPGGHVLPAMAAKGVMDWEERSPGRQWTTTGMGANRQTVDGFSGTGGRGKNTSFYAAPNFAGPMSGFRFGTWQSGLPVGTGFAAFATTPINYPVLY